MRTDEAISVVCWRAVTVVAMSGYVTTPIVTVAVAAGICADEVAGLQVDDIDWRRGEITIRGKGNRYERLPIPVDVG